MFTYQSDISANEACDVNVSMNVYVFRSYMFNFNVHLLTLHHRYNYELPI